MGAVSPDDYLAEHRAMLVVLKHQVAGYRVHFSALGEDWADGYELLTEARSGEPVAGGGPTIPAACLALARGLR